MGGFLRDNFPYRMMVPLMLNMKLKKNHKAIKIKNNYYFRIIKGNYSGSRATF